MSAAASNADRGQTSLAAAPGGAGPLPAAIGVRTRGRGAKRRAALFAGAAALVPLVLLLAPIDTHFNERLARALWNFGHIPAFALFSVIALTIARERAGLATGRAIALSAGALLLLAIATEWEQSRVGRGFSMLDVGSDMTGSLLGLALWLLHRRAPWPAIVVTTVPAMALVAGSAAEPWGIAADEIAARRAFPVLADFSSARQLTRFANPDGLRLEQRDGQHLARVPLGGSDYSGFSLLHFPRDWSGYEQLHIEVVNPQSEPLHLTCRIHDSRHNDLYADRYNRGYVLQPGNNVLRVNLAEAAAAPDTRTMDLSRIQGVICFSRQSEGQRLIFLRRLALEERTDAVRADSQ